MRLGWGFRDFGVKVFESQVDGVDRFDHHHHHHQEDYRHHKNKNTNTKKKNLNGFNDHQEIRVKEFKRFWANQVAIECVR
ncbi:uncharacterized protein MELLADRAFT_71902 [Melampsora larici-populina 98AG31]|uniref:Uncharacterized protein n=1 Tax=Melampsora larici-populina (strain 98AG31 / pathotype 3-4-7) TaxID=747676 RepID=F4RM69_MELLP|nr:uncharacterized protein MELLADRAFT_71902 [Melampsora larici-populina 98AG31]EGG06520.1 hypothetical protein MELLADRAFT_71902 [Melampsora larici-populina 98AG31]